MHIWQFLDGKPGHESQSSGLIHAFQGIGLNVNVSHILPPSRWRTLAQLATRRFPFGDTLPTPDLLIGAGHKTHLAILAAQRRHGGRSIVLMKPSLPSKLFDLCLIPDHDQADGANIITTRGVLNDIRAGGTHLPTRTLILLGGQSAHASWADQTILNQVIQLAQSSPSKEFVLSTSRRTPDSFAQALGSLSLPNLAIHLATNTPTGWVAQQLAQSSEAWISADSVSMVYEALTAGVAVGILQLPMKASSRVSRGLMHLIDQHQVTTFEQWCDNKGNLPKPQKHLAEADRCAREIVSRWPTLQN